MSGMFKSKAVTPDLISGSQETRINDLWNMIQPGLKASTSGKSMYGGELVAPLTGMENQNLATLEKYLNSDYASQSKMFQQAKDTTSQLMTEDPWAAGGSIDNTQKRLAKYLQEDLLPATRQGASATRSLYSSGYLDEESDAVSKVMDEMTKYAYDYQNNLNARKASLIPTAMSIGEYETNEPLTRLANTMGLAGYERTNYTQAKDTAEYNDYMAQLAQYLGVGTQLSGQSGQTAYYKQYQPSAFEKYVMPTMQMGVQAAGAMALAGM